MKTLYIIALCCVTLFSVADDAEKDIQSEPIYTNGLGGTLDAGTIGGGSFLIDASINIGRTIFDAGSTSQIRILEPALGVRVALHDHLEVFSNASYGRHRIFAEREDVTLSGLSVLQFGVKGVPFISEDKKHAVSFNYIAQPQYPSFLTNSTSLGHFFKLAHRSQVNESVVLRSNFGFNNQGFIDYTANLMIRSPESFTVSFEYYGARFETGDVYGHNLSVSFGGLVHPKLMLEFMGGAFQTRANSERLAYGGVASMRFSVILNKKT